MFLLKLFSWTSITSIRLEGFLFEFCLTVYFIPTKKNSKFCFSSSIQKENILPLSFQMNIYKIFHIKNPPSIPTLTLVHLYCYLVKTKFIIDWHNYGFTILALKKNAENRVVKLCKKYLFKFDLVNDI